jgi:hypothetical protein
MPTDLENVWLTRDNGWRLAGIQYTALSPEAAPADA